MPRGGEARQRVGELFAIERLDQKAVHAGFETGVAILHQRIRRQRQDRRLAAGLAGLALADPPCGLDAVELRHLDIHQHEVIGRAGGFGRQPGFQRFLAIGGDDGKMPQPRQQRTHQQRVDLVVFRHQDRKAARRRDRGRRDIVGRIDQGIAGEIRRQHFRRHGQAGRERGGAQRFDQIAGEGAEWRRLAVHAGWPA